MNLLVLDIGNSHVKLCSGRMDQPFPVNACESVPVAQCKARITALGSVDSCVVSSVNPALLTEIHNLLENRLTSGTPYRLDAAGSPLQLLVKSPETLGSDRIAAAYAAHCRSNQGAIVVDAGTAVTIDRVNRHAQFEGGVIFPGIEMNLKALHNQTGQLPLVKWDRRLNRTYGDDTQSAILAGVYWSQIGGVERVINNYLAGMGNAPILVTGGNGRMIIEHLPENAEFVPELVCEGLWNMGRDRNDSSGKTPCSD